MTIEERLESLDESVAQILEAVTELLEKVNNISTPGVDYGFEEE